MVARPKYVPNRRPGDDHIFNELANGEYEKYCVLQEGMVVVDAGAHAGFFTTYAAEKVGPKGHVYAFEPEPDNHSLLLDNTLDYQNITVRYAALWNKEEHLTLNLSHSSAEHSLVEKRAGGQSIRVSGTPLDDNIKTRVDFIKIDVEGAELQVLQGAQRILREFRPFVTMEIAVKDILAVKEFLESYGYTVYTHSYFLSAFHHGAQT